jgi:hypothetical protein
MDVNERIDIVRKTILTNKKPSYQTTNKKEVRVRCPYCGDSKKDPSHAHLYIEMRPPFKFYCQRCSTAGVLNQQTLRDLGVVNNDLSVSVIEANKTIKKGNEKITYKKTKLDFNTVNSQQSANVLDYFSYRFQKDFTLDYIVNKYKVVADSQQFFQDNNIHVPPGQYDFVNSIGFASSDNSHIIFRDITNQQRKRYYNLNLNPYEERNITNKIYNIKSNIDILSDEINLVISEGIFDIIGVYEHFYKDNIADKNNYIFASANGKGYVPVILNYMRMGFLNLNITIYSDADVHINFFKDLKKSLSYLKNTQLTIYYNTIDKDFGLPLDQINLKKVIV